MIVALGGTVLMLAIFFPALKVTANKSAAQPDFAAQLSKSVSRWVFVSALLGAIASFLNIFVDVAEAEYKTIFAGVSFHDFWRFVTITHVGHLSLARIGAMLLTALAVKLPGRIKWWLVLGLGMTATFFASLVCHAAAQTTGRGSAIALELAHLVAASVWMGPLIHLMFLRPAMESAATPSDVRLIAEIVRRFSPIAFGAVVLIAISGVVAAERFLTSPVVVPTSAYGLTLVVKLILIIPLLFAGWMNFRIIRPALLNGANSLKSTATEITASLHGLLRKFGKTLELEVTAGLLVLIVAGILASVSPPRNEAELRLTSAQSHALFTTVHLPQTQVVNPKNFYGAVERTVDDLHYAEFTHNWSGIAVLLLGLCWLAQSLWGKSKTWPGIFWPFCLIPFGIFIAVAADPEVWILRKVSLAEAFTDPTLVEHQIGALMVFLLAWLGWRDLKRPLEKRPLGYALPTLMIIGSLLLLGHAHSNYNTSQELTNLINVQHAFFGMFGLFAGVVRWLSLRGLFPPHTARVLWPGLVITLGLFMAFCYREVV